MCVAPSHDKDYIGRSLSQLITDNMNQEFSISYGQPATEKKHGFSITELKEIGVSVGVLTLAFAMAMRGGYQSIMEAPESFVLLLPIAAIAVVTAFLFHELAHKFVAQKYGCWAEFRYWKFGLLIALLFSAMGFLFAAPGAVMVSGNVTSGQNGKISAAGPTVNLGLAAGFTAGWLLFDPGLDSLLGNIFYVVGFINAFIGGFNLIPMMPFDGAKVFAWSKPVYIFMVAIAAILVILYFAPGLIF